MPTHCQTLRTVRWMKPPGSLGDGHWPIGGVISAIHTSLRRKSRTHFPSGQA